MTLIAATLAQRLPCLVSDVLLTSPSGMTSGRSPTSSFDISPRLFPNFKYKPAGWAQKLYIIQKKVCAMFAGLESEIRPFLTELETRCSYFDQGTLNSEHINQFISDYNPNINLKNSAYLVAIPEYSNDDDPETDYHLYLFGNWLTKKTSDFGVVRACGSGAHQYLNYFDIPAKVISRAPLSPEQSSIYRNVSAVARILADERETLYSRPLKNSFIG